MNIDHPDPDCAICHQPAAARCDCEIKGLETALRQAEQRIMTDVYDQIRTWVRGRAQDYILEYYRVLTNRRKEAYAAQMAHLNDHAAFYYRARPHPSEIAMANAELKRGIDDDWRSSVQRYPEVLEYFYSLVDFVRPGDNDRAVKDPPLSALSGGTRKPQLRQLEDAPEPQPSPQPPPQRRLTDRVRHSASSSKVVTAPRRMSTPFAPQPPPPVFGFGALPPAPY